MTDVVGSCPDVEWLQDLLKGLIQGQNAEVAQNAELASEQLAKCIADSVLVKGTTPYCQDNCVVASLAGKWVRISR